MVAEATLCVVYCAAGVVGVADILWLTGGDLPVRHGEYAVVVHVWSGIYLGDWFWSDSYVLMPDADELRTVAGA